MSAHQFLEARFSALKRGDYSMVYDSYHSDAPFRQQFSCRNDYLGFAEDQLSSIEIKDWRCLQKRALDDNRLQVILMMELGEGSDTQFFYELALLIKTNDECWFYHSAQKLGADDYSGSPIEVDFHHFDNITQKICF